MPRRRTIRSAATPRARRSRNQLWRVHIGAVTVQSASQAASLRRFMIIRVMPAALEQVTRVRTTAMMAAKVPCPDACSSVAGGLVTSPAVSVQILNGSPLTLPGGTWMSPVREAPVGVVHRASAGTRLVIVYPPDDDEEEDGAASSTALV
jgi:hypothetical protein